MSSSRDRQSIQYSLQIFVYFLFPGTCPPLTLNNVVANTTSQDVGTVVSLQCEEGYTLKRGASIVECLPGAYWSDSEPYCRGTQYFEPNQIFGTFCANSHIRQKIEFHFTP